MKHIYIRIMALVVLISVNGGLLLAQQQSYTLKTNESGTSKSYVARDFISMQPGFTYTAASGTNFNAKIDAMLLFPPTENYMRPDGTLTSYPSQGAAVGSIPGQFAVSPTGAATYTIPIECPPGINGMQPNISLVYNSQVGNGIVGWGWNIGGLSAVTRTGSTLYHDGEVKAIELNLSDNLMLDGQRLFLVGDVDNKWIENAEFRTEIEGYSKIIRKKVAQYLAFEVTTKDGLILEYGSSDDSRLTGLGQIPISFLLKKVTDTNGNYITYNYYKDKGDWNTGEVFLEKISYGGNSAAGTEHFYEIEFQYGERPDILYTYIGGEQLCTTRILNQIIVKNANYITSRYVLYYYMDNTVVNSKLTTVIRYNDNYEKINNTSIVWEDNNENITTESFSPDALYKQYPQGFWYADFNGDGRTDLATYVSDSTKLVFYVTNGTNKLMERWREVKMNFSTLDKETFETIIPGDFDADGLTDFLLVTNKKNNTTSEPDYVYSHSLFRNRNFEPNPGFKQASGYVEEPTIGLTGDFDGDGRLELVFENTSKTYRLSDPVIKNLNYNQNITWGQKTHTTEFPNNKYMLDFNGDGKTDIMVLDESGYRIYTMVKVNLNNEYQLLASGTYPTYNTGIYFSDLNGDGKTDIITQKTAQNDPTIDNETAIHFSTGKDFYKKLLSDMRPKKTKLFFGDFNGDGHKDIAYFTSANNFKIRLFKKQAFEAEKSFFITAGVSDLNYIMIADFNGDGRDEIIYNNYADYGSSILSYSFGKNCQDLNVSKITDGLGREIKITYNYTHDNEVYSPQNRYQSHYPLAGYTNNIRLVASYSTGNASESYQTDMKYYSARVHLQGKGFLGFESVESKNISQNILTKNTFGYNTTYFNVHPVEQTVTTLGGIPISSTSYINSYKTLGGKRIFPYVSSQTSTDHLSGLVNTKTISSHDDYGNPKTIITTQGDLVETQTINYIQKGSWCPNKPSYVNIRKTYNGDTDTRTTTYEYDDYGNLLKEVVDPAHENQVTTSYSDFTSFGQPTKVSISANGKTRTSSVEYNTPSSLFVRSKTNTLGEKTTYDWDETLGVLNSETDHWGKKTTYTYDSWGNLKETRYHDGNGSTQVTRWAEPGNSFGAKYYSYAESSGSSPVWTWYDGLGREVAVQSYGLNDKLVSVFTEYNGKGQKWRVSEPTFDAVANTWATEYIYDTYGRVESVKTLMGTTRYAYDKRNTTVTTPDGTTTTVLNAEGLTESVTTNGKKVSYSYYASGLPKTTTPEGGEKLEMSYDLQGNRIKLKDPDAGVIRSYYNGFGELVWTKQKVHTAGDSITTTNYYLDDGRLDKIDRNGEVTSYTYDTDLRHKSRVKSISIAGGHTQSFTYDDFSRVTAVTEKLDGKSWTSQTEYTTYGQVKKEIYPSGYYTFNKYDNRGNLAEVTDNKGRVIWKPVDENARGQLLEVQRGDKTTKFGYDNKGLPTSIVAAGIQDMSFFFDGKGNLQYRTDNLTGHKEQFLYDAMNRLTNWDIYKNNVRVKQNGLTYNPTTSNIQNKTDVATGDFKYGENGKPHALTSIEQPLQGINEAYLAVTYTDFKKIRTLEEGSTSYAVTYGVDDQRRKSVLTTAQGVERHDHTRYYIGNYEEEVDFLGNTKKIHYLSGGAILIMENNVETLYYAYSDYLGSLVALVHENGTVAEKYAYDPWGQRRNPTDWTQNDTRTSWIVNRGYTGHEHLDAFNIINMNGRVYDPLTASFFSPDPYVQAPENWLNYNRYAYAYGNPFRYTDPDGEFIESIIIGAIMGGFMNAGPAWVYGANFWDGFWKGALVGAVSSLVGGYVGKAVQGALNLSVGTGFWNGAIVGTTSEAAGGFVGGAGNAWINGGNLGSGLLAGLKGAGTGGLTGGIMGGVMKGSDVAKNGNANFWTGSRTAYVKSAGLSKALGYDVFAEYKGYYVGDFEGVSIYESKKLGTYSESKSGFSGGLTLPGYGITVGEGVLSRGYDIHTLRHEFGHILQADIVSTPVFYSKIGTRSLWSATINNSTTHSNYWPEKWANYLSNKYFTMKYNAMQLGPVNWDIKRFPIENISKDLFESIFKLPYSLNNIQRPIRLY